MKDSLIGQVFTNPSGRDYIVTELDPVRKNKRKMYHIEFLDSGYAALADMGDVKKGLIRDRLEPTIYGVACLGYASVKDNKKRYNRWHNIISRCYNRKNTGYHNYGGIGVSVCDRWLRYDLFLEELPYIDGYREDLYNEGILHLDKDIKQLHLPCGERIYSLETCVFVTKKENEQHRVLNEHLKHSFLATSPDGKFFKVSGMNAFAKEHGLNSSVISGCLKGRYKQHKGWTFKPL